MDQYFNSLIKTLASAAPQVMIFSFALAVVFIIGGVVLYRQRGNLRFLRGKRWPGAFCSLLGCASLALTAIQYLI